MSDVRQKRLNGFFFGVIHEDPEKKRELKTLKDADRFIEAVCSQDVPVNCITSLVSGGLPAIQLSLRLRTDPDFLNGSANNLIKYIQAPDLRTICAGDYLRRIISAIVEPPIFWDSLVRAFLDDRLQPGTQQSFAWLLLELVSLPTEKAKRYYGVAQNDKIQNRLLESPQQEVRLLGHKIKHIVSNLTSQDITAEVFQNGPGGRHDNDDIDYREISILPTADELMSQDAPFLRLARAIDDAEEDKRLSMHLDNQFRLLREDMVGEMREELKIALGISKGRHRGMVKEGFSLSGIDCGPDNRRQEWCLKLKCREDLKQMANIRDLYQRINFLRDNKNIFKHQCLTCLLADGEVVAFPSINRNEKLLAGKKSIF